MLENVPLRAETKPSEEGPPNHYFWHVVEQDHLMRVKLQKSSDISDRSHLAEIEAVLPPGALYSLRQLAWVYLDIRSGQEAFDHHILGEDSHPLRPLAGKVAGLPRHHPFEVYRRAVNFGSDGKRFDVHCCQICPTYFVMSRSDDYVSSIIPRKLMRAYQKSRSDSTDTQTIGTDGYKQGLETFGRILENVLFNGKSTPLNFGSNAVISKLGSGSATIDILKTYGFQHVTPSDPVEKAQGHPGRYKPPIVDVDHATHSRLLRAWVELRVNLMAVQPVEEGLLEVNDSRYPWLCLTVPTIHDFPISFGGRQFPVRRLITCIPNKNLPVRQCPTQPTSHLSSPGPTTFQARDILTNAEHPTASRLQARVKMSDKGWPGIEMDSTSPISFLRQFLDIVGPAHSKPARPPSLPRGLQQLGNTCYLNAILQYLYTIVDLREAVILFDCDPGILPPDDLDAQRVGGCRIFRRDFNRSRKFVDLLQRLFINLRDSDLPAVTPPIGLAKLALGGRGDDNEEDETSCSEDGGKLSSLRLGDQHDVSECLDRCIFLIEVALRFSPGGENGILDRLFRGKLRRHFTFEGDDQSSQERDESFSVLFVTVEGEGDGLYAGLAKRFNDEVSVDGKMATVTTQVVDAPIILMIQLQRAHFDKTTKETYKCSAHVKFEETLVLDRFMEDSSHSKKEISDTLQAELKNCRGHLAELGRLKPTFESATIEEVTPEEEEYLVSEDQLLAAIDDVWAVDASTEYELSSIFAHYGPHSDSGHYVFYTKGSSSDMGDCWYKFDDESVITVQKSVILGAEKGTACMLVYVRKGSGQAEVEHRSTSSCLNEY